MSEHETLERFNSIEWLAEGLGQTVPCELKDQELYAAHLYGVSGEWPTIGCEVEVNWSTLFPDLAEQYFGPRDETGHFSISYRDLSIEKQSELDELCVPLNAVVKPRYEATQQAGIPMGADAYWEFANAPTYHWQTLHHEVDLLFQHELIPAGYDHSLHITIGGLSAAGSASAYILSGLELLEVAPERILVATTATKFGTNRAWARRGNDGVRARGSDVLRLNQTTGTEFRTLTVNTAAQAERLFAGAQLLSALAMSTQEPLPDLWQHYRQTLRDVWKANDLPAESWGPPLQNPDAWRKWAEVLSRRDDEQTIEYAAVNDIKQTVTRVSKIILGRSVHSRETAV